MVTNGSCFEDEGVRYVIPHGSSLDYCQVTITGYSRNGGVRIEGRRTEGWKPDNARIATQVKPEYLTNVPSWHKDFLHLYDDPHDPRLKG